jgi:hypothetical protein
VGEPGKDYLVAGSAAEVLEAVLRIRNDPRLYRMLVTNGRRKAVHFTNEKITERWEEILSGPVLKRYGLWGKRRNYEMIRTELFRQLAFFNEKIKCWLREKKWDPIRMNQLSANRKVDKNEHQLN